MSAIAGLVYLATTTLTDLRPEWREMDRNSRRVTAAA